MRDLIVKLAKHITDCMDVTLGKTKMDETRPEYWMLDEILTDEMAQLMLKMKVRKPYTPAEVAHKLGWEVGRVEKLLEELAQIGIVEYNWHNEDRHKQYFIPVFVVGSSENLVYNKELFKRVPEKVGEFSYQMSYLPMESISHMIPPGGAGLGFHVIPVEKAIPKESQSLDVEHLSYWLERYKEKDQFAIAPCQCRRAMVTRGEGCGELEDNVCILVGDYAQYLWETGKDVKKASYDEVVALLERCEENGYMHQITNGDGPMRYSASATAPSARALDCAARSFLITPTARHRHTERGSRRKTALPAASASKSVPRALPSSDKSCARMKGRSSTRPSRCRMKRSIGAKRTGTTTTVRIIRSSAMIPALRRARPHAPHISQFRAMSKWRARADMTRPFSS